MDRLKVKIEQLFLTRMPDMLGGPGATQCPPSAHTPDFEWSLKTLSMGMNDTGDSCDRLCNTGLQGVSVSNCNEQRVNHFLCGRGFRIMRRARTIHLLRHTQEQALGASVKAK